MSQRTDKVEQEILRNVSNILVSRINNPILSSINIQSVDVSPDLKNATIYYSFLSNDDNNIEYNRMVENSVKKSEGKIRHELSKVMKIVHLPELNFVIDQSVKESSKIDKLLSDLRKKEQ